MLSSSSQQALDLINQARSALIVTHVSPDGDAIGSLLGLGRILEKLGKTEVTLACDDGVSEKHSFLPGTDTIVDTILADNSFDLLLTVDCSDERRGGKAYRTGRMSDIPAINIDHHITNTEFATVNIVQPQAASTTQVLYRLLKIWNLPLDPELALYLLTGLVTDTLCFRTSVVTQEVMAMASELMAAGADLSLVTQHTVNQKSFEAIRYWGTLLDHVQIDEHVISAYASTKQRRQTGYSANGDASIVTLLNTAREADMAVSFVETDDGKVEISFRAKPGYDVSRVALALGGGGHPAASGCTVNGPLEQVTERVLAMLKEERRKQASRL